MPDLPTLSGRELYRILLADGWEPVRRANHGELLIKRYGDQNRRTIVRNTGQDIPRGTLAAILGPRQTGLGRDGLLELIERHGR